MKTIWSPVSKPETESASNLLLSQLLDGLTEPFSCQVDEWLSRSLSGQSVAAKVSYSPIGEICFDVLDLNASS